MKTNVRIQRIAVCGMLTAIAVIFTFFKFAITDFIQPKLAFLPIACAGAMYGPLYGMLVGFASDLLGYVIRPTGPFFPGFTISAMVQGVIYGFLLHPLISGRQTGERKWMIRVIIAQALDMVIVSLVLNSLWLSMLYGKAFYVMLATRLMTSLILFPIYTLLLMLVVNILMKNSARFAVTAQKDGN